MLDLADYPYWRCQINSEEESLQYCVVNNGDIEAYQLAIHTECQLNGTHLEIEGSFSSDKNSITPKELCEQVSSLRERFLMWELRAHAIEWVERGLGVATLKGQQLDPYQLFILDVDEFAYVKLDLAPWLLDKLEEYDSRSSSSST